MTGATCWWQQVAPYFLNDPLSFINTSRLREQRKKASQEHRQFTNAFEQFSKSPEDPLLKEAVLKKRQR
jgi:hypothetical protein